MDGDGRFGSEDVGRSVVVRQKGCFWLVGVGECE